MNTLLRFAVITAFFAVLPFFHISAFAASDQEIEALKTEIQGIKSEYENRILKLEEKLAEMETKTSQAKITYSKSKDKASPSRAIYNSDLNPSIGAILGGRFAAFSSDEGEIPGFVLGHEGERGAEGISLGETELNLSTSVDHKFYGHITTALADHGGGVEIELEEAYVETLPGAGLPTGATIKFGRAFWTLGYMNEHHAHADDFADRPLPYRVFLDKSFNDTGAEITYVLPTDFYVEAGGGIFRGDDFPFAGADGNDINSFSAFLRVGGDIGGNSSWRIGGYLLDGEASGRGGGHAGHGHEDEHGDEHAAENGHGHEDEHMKMNTKMNMKMNMEMNTRRISGSSSPPVCSRATRGFTRLIFATFGPPPETSARKSCFSKVSISGVKKKASTLLRKETRSTKSTSTEEATAGMRKGFSSFRRNGESAPAIPRYTLPRIQG